MKHLKSRIFHNIQRIIWPPYWIQLHPVNYEYSAYLSEALDEPDVQINHIGKFTVDVNGVELWIENYPYSYGYVYNSSSQALPTVNVRRKLRNKTKINGNPFDRSKL